MVRKGHVTAVRFGLLVVLLAACAAFAADAPLRAGEVVSTQDQGVWTLIQAKDGAGKEFWVWSGACVVGQGGKVEVLTATHYDKLESKTLGKVLQDSYVATLIRVNGKEVHAASGHSMPEGCIVVR